MAQYDVHRNRGRSQALFPYLVVLQSGLLRRWDRRIVAPLVRSLPRGLDPAMAPRFVIEGTPAFLVVREFGNVPMAALGDIVGNLDSESDAIIRAIDLVFSRAYPE